MTDWAIPETSTTLIRDISNDADNVRWSEFVSRYRPMMFSYLKVQFPNIEADDVVQEALISLSNVLPNYRYNPEEDGHFRNYLTGILRNKALKRVKRDSRDRALKSKLLEISSSQMDSSEDDEWRVSIFEIATRQLLSDSKIPEKSKQIFLRLTVDNALPDAVATAYGTSRNNVDKIKSRMLARLREIVHALEKAADE